MIHASENSSVLAVFTF
jgi:large subunit ribosomal protein L40e